MKTAIITGASSGLGSALAKRIKTRFPDIEEVWLIARREDRLLELANTVDVKCRSIPLDLSDGAFIKRYEEFLISNKPDIALLINCAGFGMLGSFDTSILTEQLNMITVNVSALTAITRLSLDYMRADSRIVNISSIASFTPNARMAVYSATKYYVRAFSRALGMELKKRGICVTAVCPGPMSTEFTKVGRIDDNSKMFDILPRIDVDKVADHALLYSKLRLPVYTPGYFYKFFRFISAMVPDTLLMWLTRT